MTMTQHMAESVAIQKLKSLCLRHLDSKLPDNGPTEYRAKLENRLNEELERFQVLGYAPFLLFAQELVVRLKEMDIVCYHGRSTDSSSLVAHCLGLAALEPIRYGFMFDFFFSVHEKRAPFCLLIQDQDKAAVFETIWSLLPAERRQASGHLLAHSVDALEPMHIIGFQTNLLWEFLLWKLSLETGHNPADLIQSPLCSSLFQILKKTVDQEIDGQNNKVFRLALRQFDVRSVDDVMALFALNRPAGIYSGMMYGYSTGMPYFYDWNVSEAEKDCLSRFQVVSDELSSTRDILIYTEQALRIITKVGGLDAEAGYRICCNLYRLKHDRLDADWILFRDGGRLSGFADEDLGVLFKRMKEMVNFTRSKAEVASLVDHFLKRMYFKKHHARLYRQVFHQGCSNLNLLKPMKIDLDVLMPLFQESV